MFEDISTAVHSDGSILVAANFYPGIRAVPELVLWENKIHA